MKPNSTSILLLTLSVLLPGACHVHAANAPQWTAAESGRGFAVFQHPTVHPIDSRTLMPRSFVPNGSAIAREKVACELARGEWESLVVGVHGLTDLKNVRIEVDCDLNVRVYRGVDAQVQQMFDAYSPQKGTGTPIPSWMHGAFLDESNVIASIGAGSSDIFWLTLHAPPNAAAGVHRGKVRIRSDTPDAAAPSAIELDLEVKVRPFVLQRARIAYAPFFYVEWEGGQALPRFAQTDEWIGRLYRDMAEHSHTSVTFYSGGPDIDLRQIPPAKNRYLDVLVPLGKRVGLMTDDVPCISFATNLGLIDGEGKTSTEHKNRAMDWLEAEARARGWPQLVSYGWDEPGYPLPPSRGGHAAFRRFHEPMRDVRVRIGTSMGANAAYGYSDLLDVWIVYAGQITPEMCREARRLGAEVWTYSCHLHPCWPLKERYYAGFYMWVYRLKGHTTWHHYAQGHFKNVWMRDGDERPMPTVGWETRRDGVDDYRYLQMLEDSIAADPDKPAAVEARDWLDALRERLLGVDPHLVEPGEPLALEEYDQIRASAADYIETLGTAAPAVSAATAWPRGLKDEGRLYRGKSVAQCLQGLQHGDSQVRRAAAWALSEKGPDAAPAVELLAAQLQDAEVRMPALRALEAIGQKAYAAVPAISRLCSHADRYVRLGAAFTLGAIAVPWPAEDGTVPPNVLSPSQLTAVAESLRVPFRDDLHWVATPAGEALARMGPAAEPALADAIELLDRPYNLYTWGSPRVVRKVIAAIGPKAGAAVPTLMQIATDKKGNAADEILALAAIGRPTGAAVAALETFAADDKNPRRGCAFYALVCIRGETNDLTNLVNVLKTSEAGRAELARYLDALGVEASRAADEARQMLRQDDLAEKSKEQLQSFLTKVATGEGAVTLLP